MEIKILTKKEIKKVGKIQCKNKTMAVIRKKIWPKWFKIMKAEKKNVELRLADFKIKPGDILILEEWDPEQKEYTGKLLRKKVKRVIKFNPLDFYTPKAIKKYGCYLIEF